MMYRHEAKILKRGAILGLRSALVGSLAFASSHAFAIIIFTRTWEYWAWGVLLIVLIISSGLSLLPGFYGGKWLARNLYHEALIGVLTEKRAMWKGTLLGIFVGGSICLFVVVLLYHRGDIRILIFRIVSAVAIAGWMGGWVGASLVGEISRLLKERQSSDEG